MPNTHWKLMQEWPDHQERIRKLKTSNLCFARLLRQYQDINHEIHHIQTRVKNTSRQYLEERKKLRLQLKDEMYRMLTAS